MKKKLSEYEKKSWRLVIICMAAYTTVYVGRKNLSVCLPAMTAEGVLSQSLGGIIGTCFLICYAAGQFVNGWLGDRVHPSKMICGGLLFAGLMNIFMGLNSAGPMFCVYWAVCGFSCSMLWSPIIRAVSLWTTEDISLSAAASLSATIPAGTVICYLVCAAALKVSTWRAAFIVCGAILCAMSLASGAMFASLKEHTSAKKESIYTYQPSQPDGGKKNSRIAQIFSVGLLFAAFGILFNGMLKDGLDLWIPTVLKDKFIPDSSAVSLICSLLPVINIFGAYFARFIFRRFRLDELSVCGVMFALSALCLAVVTIFIHSTPSKAAGDAISPADLFTAVLVTLLLAVSSASMLGANTMLLTFIPLHYGKIGCASSVTGMLNCFSYAAAAVSSIAVGAVSDSFGWETVFVLFIASALIGGALSLSGHVKMREATDRLDKMV